MVRAAADGLRQQRPLQGEGDVALLGEELRLARLSGVPRPCRLDGLGHLAGADPGTDDGAGPVPDREQAHPPVPGAGGVPRQRGGHRDVGYDLTQLDNTEQTLGDSHVDRGQHVVQRPRRVLGPGHAVQPGHGLVYVDERQVPVQDAHPEWARIQQPCERLGTGVGFQRCRALSYCGAALTPRAASRRQVPSFGYWPGMADFTGTTQVPVPTDALFDYLSDLGNLPKYFSRMTSARAGEGAEVITTAKMPGGAEVQGDAWFRVDKTAQRIEWGSQGQSEYSGYLDVTPSGDGSQVEVHLHTTRVHEGDREVQDGVTETLDNIKQQAERGLIR